MPSSLKFFPALAVFLMLFGCSGESDEAKHIRGQFLAGCRAGEVDLDVCECVYDKLVETYSVERMIEMNKTYQPLPDFNRNMAAAYRQCQ